ncbi:hypothetical protein PHAMO_270031 [Magnetospirillum molischianum DSM 120]|uniref:Uncharacterized protein n=1 Tax=Magnetospirillum molischianum DSM 120 TaxID=1150626 RepID=H8FS52_MAGML|nr:hypothetical protein PHAMO_270031 [Magnetospirillum molischianum DSM 120]
MIKIQRHKVDGVSSGKLDEELSGFSGLRFPFGATSNEDMGMSGTEAICRDHRRGVLRDPNNRSDAE